MDAGAYFGEDGYGVGELAVGDVGDFYGDGGVALAAIVGESCVAGVEDRRVGTIEPGSVDAQDFGVGWGDRDGAGRSEEGG